MEVPDNCTKCGASFEETDSLAYPYPIKEWLCLDCMMAASKAGLSALNKVLAAGKLDLSVDEIADIVKSE
jgi:hypothetical protein